jgi:arsenate reductase
MAEGLLRRLGGDRFEVASAGVEGTFVKPLAIQAMRELGIDISAHRSKSVAEFMGLEFDTVVTVCGEYESCPIPPKAKRVRHWPFEDPSRGEGIAAYRNVRDGLRHMIEIELL